MVTLDGRTLTLEQMAAVARQAEQAELDAAAASRMRKSREVVERMAEGDEPVYAVNTGVGYLSDQRVEAAEIEQLQKNVVRSH
ncbi:MAG: aromatic amino acid lyase, partial [Bryobacteraceae bacterium]|nr:aromatic amino acid lyase [Bryobacteraceae bacterium]